VQARLRFLDELLRDLEALGDVSGDRLTADRIVRHALERILTQLVETAVAINSHIAASLLGRSPTGYRDSFALAADAGAISEELAATLFPSAGLRNLLVHEYGAIDLSRVAAATPLARTTYREYVTSVARFVTDGAQSGRG
jgi:uncharacterized protein YutE (UPF0331/DUF86 family)